MTRKLQAPNILQAQPIMDYNRRMLIDGLIRTGQAVHSRFHGTLAYLIDFCEQMGIHYTLDREESGFVLKTKPHNVQRVVVTWAKLNRSALGRVYLRLTLKDLEGRKHYLSRNTQGSEAILLLQLFEAMGILHYSPVDPMKLRRKSFYCSLNAEVYRGMPHVHVRPLILKETDHG